MQKEITELYKKHKVNPVGGCLPMLIQIPVFFALYKVLLVAIELRGAPFIFWITDLSAKDPYYVLPIVMGLTMLIQQKMTPSGMDPKQAKLMLMMPIVFTFLFLTFASGLVLYWLVNSILGIIQQFYVNAKSAKEPAAS
jgi:YidC/Oxa1 family membrane protein insertase